VKALVTGGVGFVGRYMIAALHARGYDVHSVDLEPMEVCWDPRGPEHLHVIQDALAYFRSRHHFTFDLVVHAAAAEPHRAAIDGRPMNLATNLMLDAAMFDWAVRTGQRRVLYLSSSAAYAVGFQSGHVPYRLGEDDADPDRPVTVELLGALGRMAPLRPDAAYGWSKVTGERLAAAASDAGLPVHVVRPFSGYGEDQGEDWPFGAFIARARRREDPFAIWGDGTQVRDWIHISDVVNGALAVVEADERRPVNLCTGVGTSMAELVALCCKTVGYDPEIELRVDKPAGVAYRVGDPARMREHYTASVSIEEGVRRALG
jgi:nucleoside-diphosphate-sugar epimerase